MKIVSNNKLIRRNKKIGNYTTIGSLVILGLGLYISFTAQTSDGFTWSLVCLLLGFLALPGWHILRQPLGALSPAGRTAHQRVKGSGR